jgi:hypothetical protein
MRAAAFLGAGTVGASCRSAAAQGLADIPSGLTLGAAVYVAALSTGVAVDVAGSWARRLP